MSLASKEILIIDDDQDIRRIAKKILEGAGATVFEAESSPEGLKLCEQKSPHLVITDLMMPEEDGFVFLEKKRSNPVIRPIPAVVMSAIVHKEKILKAIALGAMDYIVKPLAAQSLLGKTRKILMTGDFRAVTFKSTARPTLRVTVSGKMTLVSEAGFGIDLPIKVGKETEVEVTCSLLEELEIAKYHFRRLNSQPRPTRDTGRYLNDIVTVGISEKASTHIRKHIMRWS